MLAMNNNSMQLRTKFHYCLSKFDHSCAQNLIYEFFRKKSVKHLAPAI